MICRSAVEHWTANCKGLGHASVKDTQTFFFVRRLTKLLIFFSLHIHLRASLKDAEEESTAEFHRLTQTLLAYESVGMGFDSLVQQYTTLMAEIDNKKWALSELRQNQGSELDDLWNQH